MHNAGFNGGAIVQNMLMEHWRICFDSCRVLPQAFVRLCDFLKERGHLINNQWVSVDEQVRNFDKLLDMGIKIELFNKASNTQAK